MDDQENTQAGIDQTRSELRSVEQRNLILRGGVIYYKRVVAGRQIKFSCETRDWDEAAAIRDLYETRKGISRLPRPETGEVPMVKGLVDSGLSSSAHSDRVPRSRRLGSVIARGSDKWLVRMFKGRDATGRRRYESKVIYGSKRAAERVLASMVTCHLDTSEHVHRDCNERSSRSARYVRAENDMRKKETLARHYWASGLGGVYIAVIHVSCASGELRERLARCIKRELLARYAFEAISASCVCCKTASVEMVNGCCSQCSLNFVTKVGFSQNVEGRMRSLRPLRWGYVPLQSQSAAKAVEAAIHAILSDHQITGEYFHPSLGWLSERLPAFIADGRDTLLNNSSDQLLRRIRAEIRRF